MKIFCKTKSLQGVSFNGPPASHPASVIFSKMAHDQYSWWNWSTVIKLPLFRYIKYRLCLLQWPNTQRRRWLWPDVETVQAKGLTPNDVGYSLNSKFLIEILKPLNDPVKTIVEKNLQTRVHIKTTWQTFSNAWPKNKRLSLHVFLMQLFPQLPGEFSPSDLAADLTCWTWWLTWPLARKIHPGKWAAKIWVDRNSNLFP